METSSKTSRVCCVTGAAGFIGSWLVNKLLDRGCVVHATVRDLGDERKVGLLRALPGAAERLLLFEADLYDAATFEPAITGCEFVFLVAAPMVRHCSGGRSTDAIEAVVNATRTILEQCERSKTVRRVIYTGSLVAASPLIMEDGGGSFKDYVDESCWTPLDLSYGYSSEGLNGYVIGKTLCEKLLINSDGASQKQSRAFEVATLLCGLVGGDTLLPFLNGSLQAMVSPLTGAEAAHNNLKFLQALLGSVPLVHVDDVCDAHVFCMEMPAIAGRFLCSAAWPNMQDIVGHHARKHPESLNPAVSELTPWSAPDRPSFLSRSRACPLRSAPARHHSLLSRHLLNSVSLSLSLSLSLPSPARHHTESAALITLRDAMCAPAPHLRIPRSSLRGRGAAYRTRIGPSPRLP